MKLTLRTRLKGAKESLYLDYYSKGQRRVEYLDLFLLQDTGKLSKEQKETNAQVMELAEQIRSKRHLEIQSGAYGFNQGHGKESFIAYFEKLAQAKNGQWDSALACLKDCCPSLTFERITTKWLGQYKIYLSKAVTKSNVLLSTGTQAQYLGKVKECLKQAVIDGLITSAPTCQGIKIEQHQREFLTLHELSKLEATNCLNIVLKNAFLFSCLTGLRWSDIVRLDRKEVDHSEEMGYYLRFRQHKTGVLQTLPISEQAVELLGNHKPGLVFEGLTYNSWTNKQLQNWVTAAGVNKQISFHSARHTFAVLQLSAGTDITTICSMMGHSNLKTTMIYAKVIDGKKIEASQKIKLTIKNNL